MNIDGTTSGILAAIGAPFFMALGFIIWDITWKKVGGSAFSLNLFKCNLASIGFLIASLLLGFEAPDDGTSTTSNGDGDVWTVQNIGFLILSGAIGIIIGDLAWLQALQLLGATRVLVVDTVKPFSAAVLGWWLLGEEIKGVAFVGIGLTAVGVLIVSFEKERDGEDRDTEDGGVGVGVERLNDDDTDGGHGHNKVNYNSIIENQAGQIENREEHNPTLVHHRTNNSKDDITENSDTHDNKRDTQQHNDNAIPTLKTTTTTTTNITNTNTHDGIQKEHTALQAPPRKLRLPTGRLSRGYILAVSNVLLDTYGSVLTKKHGRGMSTWAINLIRFGSAGIFMMVLSVAMRLHHCFLHSSSKKGSSSGDGDGDDTSYRDDGDVKVPTIPWYTLPQAETNAWIKISTGVLFVTFFCPALSNYALFQIALALAITLGSISPIYALILEWPLTQKKPTVRAATGATLAVGGVIFLSILSV